MMYRVRTVFSGVPGTPWYSNLYFDAGGSGTVASIVDAVGVFWAAIDGNMSTSITWEVEGEVPTINPEGGQIEEWTNTTSETGTGGTDPGLALPWQTQALLRFSTNGLRAGRQVKGRAFIPGLSESDNDAGLVAAGSATMIQNAWNALTAATTESQQVVWARPTVGLGLGQQHLVTGASVRSAWAYLSTRRD